MTISRILYALRMFGWIGRAPYHFAQLVLALTTGRRR